MAMSSLVNRKLARLPTSDPGRRRNPESEMEKCVIVWWMFGVGGFVVNGPVLNGKTVENEKRAGSSSVKETL